MLNPNICKYVIVNVKESRTWPSGSKEYIGEYKGYRLDVNLRRKKTLKPGNRRLYLKYSIFRNRYYLSDVG